MKVRVCRLAIHWNVARSLQFRAFLVPMSEVDGVDNEAIVDSSANARIPFLV